MTSWYVIDHHGAREVPVRHAEPPPDWPALAQLALRLGVDRAAAHIEQLAQRLAQEAPGRSRHHLAIAPCGPWALATEPGVDLDVGVLSPAGAQWLVERAGCDAMFVLHDPTPGLIHLARFQAGQLRLRWEDATDPWGPNLAQSIDAQGRGIHREPRPLALELMDLPAQTPILDRHAFVDHLLAELGLPGVEALGALAPTRWVEVPDLDE